MAPEKKTTPAVKKVKPAVAHAREECDCYVGDKPVAERTCIYRPFPDGWNFVSDAGKGQVRGEVFTPRFIVDKMMVESEMFPGAAVHECLYGDSSREEMEEYISQRVVEPALGTGNYTSSVLWNKLAFARAYVDNFVEEEGERERRYLELLYTAMGSCYAFDIDPGNLEVTTRRILGDIPTALNSPEVEEKWVSAILQLLEEPEGHEEAIRAMVQHSLGEAQAHWSSMIRDDGVVQQQYKAALGEEIPSRVLEQCRVFLGENFKLFNGIVEGDTVKENFVVPGWSKVVWRWWAVAVMHDLDAVAVWKDVPMREQLMRGKIEELRGRMAAFKGENFKLSQDGLFASEEWVSPAAEKEYRAMERELKKLLPEKA